MVNKPKSGTEASKASQSSHTFTIEIHDLGSGQTHTVQVETPCISAQEILQMLNLAEQCQLYRQLPNGKRVVIQDGASLCFEDPAVPVTVYCIPVSNQEGKGSFQLPAKDREFLEAQEYEWETHRQGNHSWLIIRSYPLPEGYNASHADLALLIPPGYPTTQLDMFYVYPHLKTLSGKQINALISQPIEGRKYQRWSRHRPSTSQNQWKPGMDDVFTHLALVDYWLKIPVS